jgi:hypothetical protein
MKLWGRRLPPSGPYALAYPLILFTLETPMRNEC